MIPQLHSLSKTQYPGVQWIRGWRSGWWIMMDHGSRSLKFHSNRCGTFSMISCKYSVDCNVRVTPSRFAWWPSNSTLLIGEESCSFQHLSTPMEHKNVEIYWNSLHVLQIGTFLTAEAFISLDDHSVVVALRTSEVCWPTKTCSIVIGHNMEATRHGTNGNPLRCQWLLSKLLGLASTLASTPRTKSFRSSLLSARIWR